MIQTMRIKKKTFRFKARLWIYEGKGAWHFITLAKSLAKEIKKFSAGSAGAWGTVKVEVKIKDHSWSTSLFADTKRASYLLPVKADARKKLKLVPGDIVSGSLTVEIERGFSGDL